LLVAYSGQKLLLPHRRSNGTGRALRPVCPESEADSAFGEMFLTCVHIYTNLDGTYWIAAGTYCSGGIYHLLKYCIVILRADGYRLA
jgi:hypothetical protein